METQRKTLEVFDNNFEELVINSDKPVLVDFTAEWCGPCKMIAPVLDELATEFDGVVKVTKLDVDSNSVTTTKFGVRSLPSLLIFKNGVVVDKIIGAVPKRTIQQKLEQHK